MHVLERFVDVYRRSKSVSGHFKNVCVRLGKVYGGCGPLGSVCERIRT